MLILAIIFLIIIYQIYRTFFFLRICSCKYNENKIHFFVIFLHDFITLIIIFFPFNHTQNIKVLF